MTRHFFILPTKLLYALCPPGVWSSYSPTAPTSTQRTPVVRLPVIWLWLVDTIRYEPLVLDCFLLLPDETAAAEAADTRWLSCWRHTWSSLVLALLVLRRNLLLKRWDASTTTTSDSSTTLTPASLPTPTSASPASLASTATHNLDYPHTPALSALLLLLHLPLLLLLSYSCFFCYFYSCFSCYSYSCFFCYFYSCFSCYSYSCSPSTDPATVRGGALLRAEDTGSTGGQGSVTG